MRYVFAIVFMVSVASADLVVSGFEPVPAGDADAGGNHGGWAFLQDALHYLGTTATNGNVSVAVFRDDAATKTGFGSAFAYLTAGFNNVSDPDRSRVLGGIDIPPDGLGDWEIGYYSAGDLTGFLGGASVNGDIGSYDGASLTLGAGSRSLADVGVLVIFGNLGSVAAINGLITYATGGGGIFGIGDGPGSYDWLDALTASEIDQQNMGGSPTQGTHNGNTQPASSIGIFPNWDRYFQKSDGSPGATLAPESFGSTFLTTSYSSVIGQTDGGTAAFFGPTQVSAADPVPEPGTLALLGVGLAGLYAHRRRRESL